MYVEYVIKLVSHIHQLVANIYAEYSTYNDVLQDLATHTRVSPAARQASLVRLAKSINQTPAAKAELDKWGLMIDESLMNVRTVVFYKLARFRTVSNLRIVNRQLCKN